MFPWLMPPSGMGSQLSLLSMMSGASPQSSYAFGSNPYSDPNYWTNANASRQPGQSNWDLYMHGMLPQSMWPQQWKDQPSNGDRSDQNGNQNQPDTGNPMAAPGPAGGPDSNPQAPYDPNTVSPQSSYGGYDPASWMKAMANLGGGAGASAKRNANQAMSLGAFGLSMLQPRPPAHTGPYPWI